jgi:outer membrane protein assembly factor BamB
VLHLYSLQLTAIYPRYISYLTISTFVLLSLLNLAINAQTWPQFRRDNTLRGRVAVRTPGQPSNFAEFALTGGALQPIIADLDADQLPEILLLPQGRLQIFDSNGTLQTDTFLGITEIVAIQDIIGDSADKFGKEILAINANTRTLMLLTADGQLLWQFSFPEVVSLSSIYCKVADLRSDKLGKEIIVFPDHTKTTDDAHGYFFTAMGQLYARPRVANLFGGQLNFPQIAVADLDKDNNLEVVVVGRPRIMIFSVMGVLQRQLEFREGDPEGRHYGLLQLADVNGDGTLEAIIIADEIPTVIAGKSQAITVLQLTPTIKRIWGVTFPQQQLQAVLHSVADVNADGRSEVIVNVWTGDEWRVQIYRGMGNTAGQAEILAVLRGVYCWEVADLDGDSRPELLTSAEQSANATLNFNSELHIYRLAGIVPDTMLFLDAMRPVAGAYLLQRLLTIDGLGLERGVSSTNLSQILLTNANDQTNNQINRQRFFIYSQASNNSSSGPIINLEQCSLVIGNEGFRIRRDFQTPRPGLVRAIWTNSLGVEEFLINREVDKTVVGELAYYIKRNHKLRLRRDTAVITAKATTSEVRVADLDDDRENEILVKSAANKISVLHYDNITGELNLVTEFVGTSVPIILPILPGDDTEPARLITTRNNSGQLAILYYEAQQTANKQLRLRLRWEQTLTVAANTNIELVAGNFRTNGDVLVTTPRGHTQLLAAKDGSVQWQRSEVFTFGNQVAARDANQDGRDDVYIVANNLYRVLDGVTGRDLIGPINLSQLASDFDATPVLAGDREVLLVGAGTVVKILESGTALWNFAKTLNGQPVQRQKTRLLMGIAELGNGGGIDLIGGNYGEDEAFYTYDYETGRLRYRTTYRPVSDIITADVDGDGSDEFVFATAAGEIVALQAANGQPLWTLPLGTLAGDPVLAAIGKDRRTALLISPGNGTLRVYPFATTVSDENKLLNNEKRNLTMKKGDEFHLPQSFIN